ncbi:MAG TPA: preprotein translocase subunit SecY [Solirubrobacteraceae bacterium]|nr:preprotein translocase subunit SecY [Solirubrobacteraceae bacterium]
MISTILGAFRVREIRNKVLFTAALLALYRLGSYIPAPGISASAVNNISKTLGNSSILGLLNTFSGGGLGRLAIFALGIMPFITSSIIFQLLQAVVPSLEQLRKEPTGQERLTQYQRYLTVGLAFAQSIGYVFLFRSLENQSGVQLITNFNVAKVFLIAITLTAGTILLMWFGELITQRGIGNGISLLIFASIVSRIPGGISSWWNSSNATFKVMMPFIVIAVVAAIVFVQEGQRRIPIQYARRTIGQRMVSGQQTYMPLRINMAGVIPVIFAATVMTIPPTIGQIIGKNRTGFFTNLYNFFAPGGWHYVLGECLLIIVFTYFYTAVTFNPIEQSDELRKAGGFIPGVRPGRPTAEFLDRVLARLTLPGALFLAAIAALPTILIAQTGANFAFGGTSILIVIGVALDTMKQLEAQLMMRNYEGFLK